MTDWFRDHGKRALLETLGAACDDVKAKLDAEIQRENAVRDSLRAEEIEYLKTRCATVEKLESENQVLRQKLCALRERLQDGSHGTALQTIQKEDRLSHGETATVEAVRAPSTDASKEVDATTGATTGSIEPSGAQTSRSSSAISGKRSGKENHDLLEKYRISQKGLKEAEVMLRNCVNERDELERLVISLRRRLKKALKTSNASGGWLANGDIADTTLATNTVDEPLEHGPAIIAAENYDGVPEPDKASALKCGSSINARKRPAECDASTESGGSSQILPSIEVHPGPKSVNTGILASQGTPDPHLGIQEDCSLFRNVAIKRESSADEPLVVSERIVRKRRRLDGGLSATPPRPPKIKEEELNSDPIVTGDASHFSPQESLDLDEHTAIPTPKRAAPTALEVKPCRSPLAPISANARSKGRTAGKSRSGWTLVAAVNALSEDWSEHDDQEFNARLLEDGRLNTLLNTPPTDTGGPLVKPHSHRRKLALDTVVTPSATARRDFGVSAGSKQAKTDRQTALAQRVALRQTPMTNLRLEDFKVNPRFSEGQGFAFSDVVRRKADRAELAACVDPDCCGKDFLAMAQSELHAAGQSIVYQAASAQLMGEYLGEAAHRLANMSPEERAGLWLKARTHDLANKHSKHRHRFQRRASPPGFWNADFPSTQEIERDREAGDRMLGRMVEDRWREAMREGGRWLFRDE